MVTIRPGRSTRYTIVAETFVIVYMLVQSIAIKTHLLLLMNKKQFDYYQTFMAETEQHGKPKTMDKVKIVGKLM